MTPYREWAIYKGQPLQYSERDSWDQMLQQCIQLLERFSHPPAPTDLQIKFVRPLSAGNEFVPMWMA